MRDGDRIVDAPTGDVDVARSYARFDAKGPIVAGQRLTLLTRSLERRPGEEVRVIHVVELIESGHVAYVMGPKPIVGEYVNGALVTASPSPGDPLVPETYNGATIPSPAVDYNYDITSYRFEAPGVYDIQWRLGELHSNVLSIRVAQ